MIDQERRELGRLAGEGDFAAAERLVWLNRNIEGRPCPTQPDWFQSFWATDFSASAHDRVSLDKRYYRDNLLAVLEACAAVPEIYKILSCGDFFGEWVYKLRGQKCSDPFTHLSIVDPLRGMPNRSYKDLAGDLSALIHPDKIEATRARAI